MQSRKASCFSSSTGASDSPSSGASWSSISSTGAGCIGWFKNLARQARPWRIVQVHLISWEEVNSSWTTLWSTSRSAASNSSQSLHVLVPQPQASHTVHVQQHWRVHRPIIPDAVRSWCTRSCFHVRNVSIHSKSFDVSVSIATRANGVWWSSGWFAPQCLGLLCDGGVSALSDIIVPMTWIPAPFGVKVTGMMR